MTHEEKTNRIIALTKIMESGYLTVKDIAKAELEKFLQTSSDLDKHPDAICDEKFMENWLDKLVDRITYEQLTKDGWVEKERYLAMGEEYNFWYKGKNVIYVGGCNCKVFSYSGGEPSIRFYTLEKLNKYYDDLNKKREKENEKAANAVLETIVEFMKSGTKFTWDMKTADLLLRMFNANMNFNFTETKEIIERKLKQ